MDSKPFASGYTVLYSDLCVVVTRPHLSTTHSLRMWCTRSSLPSPSSTAQRLRVRSVQYRGLRLAASTRACGGSRQHMITGHAPRLHRVVSHCCAKTLLHAAACSPVCCAHVLAVCKAEALFHKLSCTCLGCMHAVSHDALSVLTGTRPPRTHQAAAELCCIKGCEEAQRAHCKTHHGWQGHVLSKQAGQVPAVMEAGRRH